ncbi:MAG: TIGR00159 family protein [Clostridiales bacterium]|nr:TIGR00159 family protein [Clostridiales bacterium]
MVFWNITHQPRWNDIVDILLLAFLLYWLVKISRHTRAVQVMKGLAILIALNYLSAMLGFTAFNWVMRTVLNNGVLLIIVLFQPEIRKALEQLGRGAHMDHSRSSGDRNEQIVSELIRCATRLSARRVGALIVFEQNTGLQDYMETGVPVDADISDALLENIFEPNTPLHDGAVIIRNSRVATAACVLTLSDSSSISQDLGTRHRAALGVSEQTDAKVLIVSEETGIISMARNGKLTRHLDENSLRKLLTEIFPPVPNTLKEKIREAVAGVKKVFRHE